MPASPSSTAPKAQPFDTIGLAPSAAAAAQVRVAEFGVAEQHRRVVLLSLQRGPESLGDTYRAVICRRPRFDHRRSAGVPRRGTDCGGCRPHRQPLQGNGGGHGELGPCVDGDQRDESQTFRG